MFPMRVTFSQWSTAGAIATLGKGATIAEPAVEHSGQKREAAGSDFSSAQK